MTQILLEEPLFKDISGSYISSNSIYKDATLTTQFSVTSRGKSRIRKNSIDIKSRWRYFPAYLNIKRIHQNITASRSNNLKEWKQNCQSHNILTLDFLLNSEANLQSSFPPPPPRDSHTKHPLLRYFSSNNF